MNFPKSEVCPVTFALGLFGDRWTLRIMHCMLLQGACRFREIESAIPGIATNILSERIKRLDNYGIIRRAPDRDDRRQRIYLVTEKGIALLPILIEMVVWAERNGSEESGSNLWRRYEQDREGLLSDLTSKARKFGSLDRDD